MNEQSQRTGRFSSGCRTTMRSRHTCGLTKIEALISTALLVVVMSVSATMFHKTNLIWKDLRHHRIAIGELTNQLDVFMRIEAGEIESALEAVKPSAICSDALPNPILSASVTKDAIGDRIDLEIQWQSRNGTRTEPRPNRVRLSGWFKGGRPNDR